jgi:hypothetical protein
MFPMKRKFARQRLIAWSLLWTCLLVAPARAEDIAQRRSLVRAKQQEAITLAEEGSYIAALAAIDDGLGLAPRNVALMQLRAKLLLDKQDFAHALRAYEALLDTALSSANRRKVRGIIQYLMPARSSFVEIALNVKADVYVGHKAQGKACEAASTCKLALLPGRYRLYIERPGFKPSVQVVRVRRDQTVSVHQELEELPSKLELGVTPADAVVTVDGQVWQAGEGELAPGKHTLHVWRPGFFAHQAEITAHEGEPVALSVALEERQVVSVSLPAARLFLDGQRVRMVGHAVRLSGNHARLVVEGALRLPAERREHTLVVEAEGYEPFTMTLPADRPFEHGLDIVLVPVPPAEPEIVAEGHSEWTPIKIAVTTSAGTAALAGLGTAIAYTVRARGLMARVGEHCNSDGGGGLSCDDEGNAAAVAAEQAATRANQTFTAGTLLALGTLHAWNINERPDSDGMSLRRKLSIGASAGAAAAGVAAGLLYGQRAQALRAGVGEECRTGQRCQGEEFVRMRQARSAAGTANLGFTVAGVAAASAALLWWRAPEPRATEGRLRIEATIQPGQVGLGISGGF